MNCGQVTASKIEVARLPLGHIRRAHLYDRLLAGSESSAERCAAPPVTLVCAPPGFGKTTLVADCVRQRKAASAAAPTAWVSLDDRDNVPGVFWSAVLAALGDDVIPVSTPGELPLSPPQPGVEQRFIVDFVELVDRQPNVIWLVIDDLQALHEDAAWDSLGLLIRRLPRKLRVFLVSRVDPPLPLHRLRTSGQLCEVRAGDLAFSAAETEAVLSGHGVTLVEEDLTRLLARTEGWPVCVQLAALTLRRSHDHRATIESFVETDRGLSEFLVGEVLSQLPAELGDFLLRTSVCDRFTAELAAVLTGRDDAGLLLARLERSIALISRSGQNGLWYHYHSSLLDYLRVVHWRRAPRLVAALHWRAAVWFAEHDEPLTALRLSVSGRCHELTAELVAAHGPSLVLGGEMATLRGLAGAMTPDVLARPEVVLVLALADLADGRRAAGEMRMSRLAGNPAIHQDERLRDLWLVVLAHHARLTGRMAPEAEALGERLERIADPALRTLALVNRGTLLIWLDRYRAAADVLGQARQLASDLRFDYATLHCLSHLAGLAAVQSDYPGMRRAADEAIMFAAEHGISRSGACCLAYAVAAWAAYQFLENHNASAYSRMAAQLLGAGTDRTVELATRSVAALADLRKDPNGGLERLRACWTAADPREEPLLRAMVANEVVLEQRMALRLGRLDWATEAIGRAKLWLGSTGEALLLESRLHVHFGRTNRARALLDRVVTGVVTCEVVNTVIEVDLLAAALASRVGDERTAHLRLLAALEQAAPRRALRPFFDAGPDIRELVATEVGRLGLFDGFATEVLAAIPPASPSTMAELTPRELQLLRELPSMETVEEMARSLFVSVNTVKTHLRSVYRKLGVTSRREAVVAARRWGLL